MALGAERILIVKTSSMGDVVHALPAVSDMLAAQPGRQVDWLVEAPFAAIPALHPGVSRVIPLAWRKWRKALGKGATWQAIGALREALRAQRYDAVLDLQGLLKSVMWGLQARGPLLGYDAASIREPAAALFYRRRAAVSRDLQAVVRNRALAAAHLGYPMPQTPPDFGLRAPASTWMPAGRYAVLIPCASRPEKLWPIEDWIAVGRHCQALGWLPVILWGSPAEQALAESIAAGCGGCVPPFLRVGDCAAVLAGAEQIVGLDTGFTHLGAACGRPTVGIYCDHEPGLAGVSGPGPVTSLGGVGQRPTRAAVLQAFEAQRLAAGEGVPLAAPPPGDASAR
jgi:heptosyltransferase-1